MHFVFMLISAPNVDPGMFMNLACVKCNEDQAGSQEQSFSEVHIAEL